MFRPTRLSHDDAVTLEASLGLAGRFFAVPPDAPRDRRPTDVTMLVLTTIVLTVYAFRAGSPMSALEGAIADVIASIPGILDPLWFIAHDSLILWGLVVLVVACLRRQWRLVLSMLVAAVAVTFSGMVIGRLANGEWPQLLHRVFTVSEPVDYPAVGLAMWVALASVASAYLSRPFRFFGRWMVGIGSFSFFALGVAEPGATVGAMALGSAVAAAVHLTFGSPAGLPKLSAVTQVLASMGVLATPSTVSRVNGVVRVRAVSDHGADLDVKIYGRDAWDGQLLITLWRFFWYRKGGRALVLTRLQQVEHEAFLTLLAERRGVATYSVLAAGTNVIGDAVLVVERRGHLLSEGAAHTTDEQLALLWKALDDLHDAGLTHGAIDAHRVFIDGDVVGFADLSSGEVMSGLTEPLIDHAQMLVTTTTYVGTERAVAAALAALGSERLAAASSFVQPAALSPVLRRSADAADVDIDQLRAAVVLASGEEPRDLQRLRRVTLGGLFTALLLFVAGYVLISGILEIGLSTITSAISEASLPLLIVAFLVSSLGRVSNAVALSGISPTPVPLGRLTALQFAMTFVSLAMPSTAGRVAVNIRFFQRNGVEPTTAVAMGATDGFTGFLAQITLFFTIVFFGLGSLNLDLSENFSIDQVTTLLIWLGVLLVIGLVIVFAVTAIRHWVFDKYHKVKVFIVTLLRSPKRLATAFGANMMSELIGALTLYTVLLAFGQSVRYLDVVLVSIAVALFAGLMPVPGGIGVSEAALTAGFIAIGVDPSVAFAAALTCRMITFYFPPVIGVFAFRWLQKQRYL
jgi:uncharacterized protein (TIRG00374 family)